MINHPVISNPSTYIIVSTVFSNLLLSWQTNTQPLFIGARRPWLSVNLVKGNKPFTIVKCYGTKKYVLKIWNWQGVRNPLPTRIYWWMYSRLNQSEWVYPLVNSQKKMDSVVGGGTQEQWKNKLNIAHMIKIHIEATLNLIQGIKKT